MWYKSIAKNILLLANKILIFNINEDFPTLNIFPSIGLSRDLINLINGESLMTAIISFIMFNSIVDVNTSLKSVNTSLGKDLCFFP